MILCYRKGFFPAKEQLNLYPFFQAQEKLGPVDMLVNCAGTSVTGKFEDIEVNSFEVSEHTFLFYYMMISYSTVLTLHLYIFSDFVLIVIHFIFGSCQN